MDSGPWDDSRILEGHSFTAMHHNAIPSEESSVAILQQLDTVANAIRLKNRAASQPALSPASYAGTERSSPIEQTRTIRTPPHHHTTNQDCPGGQISVPPLSPTVARKRILPTYSKPLLASRARTSMHGSQGSQTRLPCTSAPNQRTESSNPCLPRGCCRTRTE